MVVGTSGGKKKKKISRQVLEGSQRTTYKGRRDDGVGGSRGFKMLKHLGDKENSSQPKEKKGGQRARKKQDKKMERGPGPKGSRLKIRDGSAI